MFVWQDIITTYGNFLIRAIIVLVKAGKRLKGLYLDLHGQGSL